jgi:hypothetical protein
MPRTMMRIIGRMTMKNSPSRSRSVRRKFAPAIARMRLIGR